MKKQITRSLLYFSLLLLAILSSFSLSAQAPQSLNYQAVARDANGVILVNRATGLRITILNGPEGEILYQETHQSTTNQFGLLTLAIGGGTPVVNSFAGIPWGTSTPWLQVEMDANGGSDYLTMGLTQLLSVPYALYAASGTEGPAGEKGDKGDQGIQGPPGENGTNGSNGMDGEDGSRWHTGVGAPAPDLGVTNDFYLDSLTGDFYWKIEFLTWLLSGNLKGPAGEPSVLANGDQAGNTPYWNGTNWVLNNSNIFNNGDLVGINTTSPVGRLHIKGTTDISQVVVDANTTQSNSNPIIKIRDANGNELLGIHSDDSLNLYVGNAAGLSNQKGSGALYNTFIGNQAGQNNTTGFSNTVLGSGSMLLNSIGYSNTVVGALALPANTTGSNNTAIGAFSLRNNTTGAGNTAIGVLSLSMNTIASGNTAVGEGSLASNINGSNNSAHGFNALNFNSGGHTNTANGAFSLHLNTVGYENTAGGAFSLYTNSTGFYNTAFGAYALNKNTIGTGNTAMGRYALHLNTTGNNNTAIGVQTLSFSTTGINNSALGAAALQANTSGNSNSAYGMTALFLNTTGNDNTALGQASLYANTTASRNTGVGAAALNDNTTGENNTAIGAYSLTVNTTGFSNTAVGQDAMDVNITGSFNTAVGEQASFNSPNLDNTTCIGYLSGGIVNSSNRVEIGNSSVTVIAGQVGFSTYSDARIKDNVRADVAGLDFINRLRPVTYNLNIHRQNEMLSADRSPEWNDKYAIEQIRMTGFLAQEVEEAANLSGYNFSGIQKPENANELYSIRYSDFVMPLVKSVQEVNQKLEEEVAVLKSQNQELLVRLEKLETMITQKN